MLFLTAYAASVHEAVEPTGGLAALGLDLSAFVFQVVNFAVLLGLLWLFAYKPILKILEERRRRIEDALTEAQRMSEERAAWEAQRKSILAQARQEAVTIVQQGEVRVTKLIQTAEAQARSYQEKARQDSQRQIAQEIAQAKRGLQREIVGLVAYATEHLIGIKLDPKQDAALIKERLKKLA